MFVLMAGLMALGALMVYSATYVRLETESRGSDGRDEAPVGVRLVLALVAFIAGSMIDYRDLPTHTCPDIRNHRGRPGGGFVLPASPRSFQMDPGGILPVPAFRIRQGGSGRWYLPGSWHKNPDGNSSWKSSGFVPGP